MESHHGDGSPGSDREPDLRASDSERERVVELLSAHAAEGRLTLEELDARIDDADAARTRGELASVTADLPVIDGRDASATTSERGRRRRPSRRLTVYVAVNLMLVAVWALTGAGYFWPIWPILGWGLGLVKRGRCGHLLRRGRARRGPADQPARTSTPNSAAEAATLP